VTTPKRGRRFLHKRYITFDAERKPETCRITHVGKGVVYYRLEDGAGARVWIGADKLEEVAVLRWLDDEKG